MSTTAHHHGSHAAPTEANPHGEHHAAHVIIPPITLASVLGILLFFTLLTVGLALLEVWIQSYFHIVLPHWVNIAIAMSIASVKAVLVMAIFMQLRYDNRMNTLVMLFTFFAVGLFLFFSGLDLFTRNAVTPWKAEYVVPGGTWANGEPIVKVARDKAITAWGPEKFARIEAATKHALGHAHGEEEVSPVSTASVSRAPRGDTTALRNAGHEAGEGGAHEAAPEHSGETHTTGQTPAEPAKH